MTLLNTAILMIFTISAFSQQKGVLERNKEQKDSILGQTEVNSNFIHSKIHDSMSIHPMDSLKLSVFDHVNELDEVMVKSKSGFNAVSLGIIPKEIKPLSQSERELYTAGDFKPIHLLALLGGSMQLDPVINAITGRTKRLKKYIKYESKINNLDFLEQNYTDFMRNNLHIDAQVIGIFLAYLMEDEKLSALIRAKDYGELAFYIGDAWFRFENFQKQASINIKD